MNPTQQRPKVSVVVAARNESKHIEEAISSIASQKGVDLELVFVDDNSTDQTFSIASALAATNPRIRLFKNPKHGKCSAFNLGVNNSIGDFICIFAGDDIMPQGSLKARLDAVLALGASENVIGLSKIRSMSQIKKYDGMIVPRRSGHSSLSGVSPLMHRSAALRIFPVPETLPNEDTWMELGILYLPNIQTIQTDIIACNWRVHEGNSINRLAGFTTYNAKITLRMQALRLFYDRHYGEIDDRAKALLLARVQCEERRVSGDIFGVLRSKVSWKDRLRALSSTNSFFYWFRSSFFRLFSGW